MKQYFAFKSFFLGAALLISGTIGLVSTADAYNSYSYKKSSKSYYKGNSNKRYSKKYSYKNSNKGYYGKRNYKKGYNYGKGYNKGFKYSKGYNKGFKYSKGNNKGYKYNKSYNKGYKYNSKYYDKSFSRSHKSKHQCFNYSVKAIGGYGGFRFQHDVNGFKRFGNEGYSGQICGHNHAEFELSKLDPGVKVALKINGKQFIYGSNSGHDRHINNWHRKYFSVKLGH